MERNPRRLDAIQAENLSEAYMGERQAIYRKGGLEWNSPILEWGTNLTGLISPEGGATPRRDTSPLSSGYGLSSLP